MVIALAFFKRVFTRSLPMNQAHGLIIAEVYGACWVSTNTTFAQAKARRRVMRRRAEVPRRSGKFTDGSGQNFLPCGGTPSRPLTTRDRGRSSGSVSRQSRASQEP